MGKLSYKITNKDGDVVFITSSPARAFFFGAISENNTTLTSAEVEKRVNLATTMWLKDANQTPLGELADFVADNDRYESLLDEEKNKDATSEQLSMFYMSI